jgi:hypothetical protein
MGEVNHLWNKNAGTSLTAWTYVIIFYYPFQPWWCLHAAHNVFVGVVGAIGLSARCCMGIINYLWNTGAGGSLTAWTFVIVFYHPIQV